jgi:hypothetical protein
MRAQRTRAGINCLAIDDVDDVDVRGTREGR